MEASPSPLGLARCRLETRRARSGSLRSGPSGLLRENDDGEQDGESDEGQEAEALEGDLLSGHLLSH